MPWFKSKSKAFDAAAKSRALAWVHENVKCRYAGSMDVETSYGFTAFDTKSEERWFEVWTGVGPPSVTCPGPDHPARVDLLSVADDAQPIGALVACELIKSQDAPIEVLLHKLASFQVGEFLVDESLANGHARALEVSGGLAFGYQIGDGLTPSETMDDMGIDAIKTDVTGRVWAFCEPRDVSGFIEQVLFLRDEYVSAFALDTPSE